jgi:hypothetical protein
MTKWLVRAWAIGLALVVAVGLSGVDLGPAGAVTKGQLRSLLLQAEDLGSGWQKINLGSASGSVPSCLVTFNQIPKRIVRVQVQFQYHGSVPLLSEELQAGPGVKKRLTAAQAALNACSTMSLNENGQGITVVLQAVPTFPQIGDASSAYTGAAQVASTTVGLDIVLFRTGSFVGELLYVDQGAPNQGQVAGYAQVAAATIQSVPITPAPSSG